MFTDEIYPGARAEPRMPPPVYKAISDAIQARPAQWAESGAGGGGGLRPDRRLSLRLQGRADPLMQDRTETHQGVRVAAPSIDGGPRLSNRARERIAGYLFVAPDA